MTKEKQNQALDVNETIAKSESIVSKHPKSIIAAAVAILLLVGGFFAVKYYYLTPREEKAQTLLAMGQNYLIQGEYEKALNGDGQTFPGYLKISSEYSFTDAANLAHAYAGICYAKTNKVAEAIASLEQFSPQNDATISPAILGTLANCYATNKDLDKAVKTFKEAAELADNASLSPLFLIEAGKLLESQGNSEEALKLYNEVKTNYPTSSQAAPNMQNGKNIAPEIDKYIERASK